jgi:hypothetical protein
MTSRLKKGVLAMLLPRKGMPTMAGRGLRTKQNGFQKSFGGLARWEYNTTTKKG